MKLVEGSFCGLVDTEIDLFRRVLAELEKAYNSQGGWIRYTPDPSKITEYYAVEGVEIGCMDGFSTAHLLEATKQMHLTTIDPFIPDSMAPNLIGQKDRFLANVEPWKDRVTLIEDYSQNVVMTFNKHIQFLFIDGDHTYPAVMRDFDQWVPFLETGGILAMHDSRMLRHQDEKRAKFHPGPSQVATDNVYGKPERWEILGETWALTVARKKG